MTLFDRYVVVDWSAAGRPVTGANSIWVADLDRMAPVEVSNPATRSIAADLIRDIVVASADRRVLLGVDVSLGYPAGSAARLGLTGTPWCAMWDELSALVVDDPSNRNNRFAVAVELNRRWGSGPGPFWGCPANLAGTALTTNRPAGDGAVQFRRTELALRELGWRPKSSWQLAYRGSVGSQTLTAIPVLARLRREFSGRLTVWPFAGAVAPVTAAGSVVVAEVYPSMFPVDVPPGGVLDATQVAAVADAMSDADAAGALASWFAPALDEAERDAVEREEGWVLGPPGARPVR